MIQDVISIHVFIKVKTYGKGKNTLAPGIKVKIQQSMKHLDRPSIKVVTFFKVYREIQTKEKLH